jgi:hypothetical protein
VDEVEAIHPDDVGVVDEGLGIASIFDPHGACSPLPFLHSTGRCHPRTAGPHDRGLLCRSHPQLHLDAIAPWHQSAACSRGSLPPRQDHMIRT